MVSFGRKDSTVEVEAPEQQQPQPAAQYAPATAQLAAFPRVNLIPDEIALEAKVRRSKVVLVGAVAASVLGVGAMYLLATNDVNSAQDQLTMATARSASLAAEATKYADVPKVKSDLASAQAQQALAMGGEVRWSFVLNNLALTLPAGTSISALNGTITGQAPAAPAAGATTGTQSVKSILGKPGIGSLQFEGDALDNPHVASFLEAISRNTGMTDPFVSSVTKDDSNKTATVPPVKFTATTTIDAKALSHRFDVKGN